MPTFPARVGSRQYFAVVHRYMLFSIDDLITKVIFKKRFVRFYYRSGSCEKAVRAKLSQGAISAINRTVLSSPSPSTLSKKVHRRCFCCGSSVLPARFVQWSPFVDFDLLCVAVGLSYTSYLYRKILTSFVLCSVLFNF